jgi:ABC-type nitrate/sulfonate/bicarbonate transport system substrate-binding protein
MDRTISRRALLLNLSAATCALAAAPRALPVAAPTPIKIANASGALTLTMQQLLRQERFLESFGLAPEMLSVADGTRILGGIVGGSVDASMMSGFGQVFPAIEHGASIKILAGGAVLPILALFSAKASVKTLQDLQGKIIGTGAIGALLYQLTAALLSKYRVDLSTVRFVNIGSSADILRAVAAGTVDAGAADAALIGSAAQYGVHLIEHGNMSTELREFTFQGAWASTDKITSMRDALVRALAAHAKLYRFVQSPEAKTAFLAAGRTVFPNLPESAHTAQWEYVQAYKPFAEDLTLSPARLKYVQDLNVSFKVQKEPLPFERVADMSLAQDALKLLSVQRA